jgi:hypothetical protein
LILFLFSLQLNLFLRDQQSLCYPYYDKGALYNIVDSPEKVGTIKFDGEFIFWDTFFIGGGMNVITSYTMGKSSFKPYNLDSSFKAGFRFFSDQLEIGFTHECNHPIYPWLGNPNMRIEKVLTTETMRETVYIMIKGKVEFK